MAQGSGLRSWIYQRLTAVFLGVYTCYFLIFFMNNPNVSYQDWTALWQHSWVQISTLIALLCVSVHAWIGVWTIATDYLKVTFIRVTFLSLTALLLVVYFAWGIKILWS